MFLFHLGRWNNTEDDGLKKERVYIGGHIWTPIVKITHVVRTNPENSLEERIEKLRGLLEIQGNDGNWNHNEYMLGMYNGMECMLAVLENREVVYRDQPEKYINDFPSSVTSTVIQNDVLEHLLNCMANQKFINEQSPEIQKEWQNIIDQAYHEARTLLHAKRE
jgi:hypothetical protein